MTDKAEFHVKECFGTSDFESLEEATKFAKKVAMETKEDVTISKDVAVVKFPVPDYEVVELA